MLYKKVHKQRLREFWIDRGFKVGRKFRVGNIGIYEYEVISKPFINCPERSICIRIKCNEVICIWSLIIMKKIIGLHVGMDKDDIFWID